MPDDISNTNTKDIMIGLEPLPPTTEASQLSTVGPNTWQKYLTTLSSQETQVVNKVGSYGRKFQLPAREEREKQYTQACTERELFESNKQPFIFPGFTEEGDFFLSQGLTLVGARSGHSKSTTAAHILAGFIAYKPDTTALVLSNEELTDAIINRTACVLLQKSYMRFHKGELRPHEMAEVRLKAKEVISRVVVINDPSWDTTCLEDVQAILEGSPAQGVNMVLIDYYQTITHSKANEDMESFAVLKQFGRFIRKYGMRCPVPVVVMCQLNPTSLNATEFQARVQNDKTIYNDAFNVVEIVPDFETHLTEFIIHKQRFGFSQGTKVSLMFDRGLYKWGADVGF